MYNIQWKEARGSDLDMTSRMREKVREDTEEKKYTGIAENRKTGREQEVRR